MSRKRWTPEVKPNEHTHILRQKKKWQIALRRYILEGQKSAMYAPYFGLGAAMFRKWIEAQFEPTMNWDNFSTVWQLDHIIPIAYFNPELESDLKLGWNFINIRPGRIAAEDPAVQKVNVLTAKAYFAYLLEKTGLTQCDLMLQKIKSLEAAQEPQAAQAIAFLQSHKEELEIMPQFDASDLERLNTGTPFKDLAFEKAFLKKFA